MSDLQTRFQKAAFLIRNGPPRDASNEQKLNFYAYFKQATEGDVKGTQPWAVQLEARAKWDAWYVDLFYFCFLNIFLVWLIATQEQSKGNGQGRGDGKVHFGRCRGRRQLGIARRFEELYGLSPRVEIHCIDGRICFEFRFGWISFVFLICVMVDSSSRTTVSAAAKHARSVDAPSTAPSSSNNNNATKKQKTSDSHDASADCPYLDTIDRYRLDFDFEKVCSVSLSNLNVYACLVCGKYFQGRGQSSHAYFHSMDDNHHVFINLHSLKVRARRFWRSLG
jgi:acyl-CoA-binding protein